MSRTPAWMKEALRSPPEKVDLEAICHHFVRDMGGIAAVSAMLKDEFEASEPGSPVRARILEMVLRGFTKLDGKNNSLDDLTNLNDDDLERLYTQKAAQLIGVSDAPAGDASGRPEEKAGGTAAEGPQGKAPGGSPGPHPDSAGAGAIPDPGPL